MKVDLKEMQKIIKEFRSKRITLNELSEKYQIKRTTIEYYLYRRN